MNLKDFFANLLVFFFPPKDVTILAYHSVSDGQTPISVSTSEFRSQMEYLKKEGFNVINLESYIEIFEGRKKASKKSVLITFDDGYKDVYENALPILKRLTFPSVMSVNPLHVGMVAVFATRVVDKSRPVCTIEELNILADSGMSVVNHGFSHKDFTTLDGTEIAYEYSAAKEWIEKNIKNNRYGNILVFPKGSKDARSVFELEKLGARIIFNTRVDVYPNRSLGYFILNLHPVFRFFRQSISGTCA